jgi:hypothetical protein
MVQNLFIPAVEGHHQRCKFVYMALISHSSHSKGNCYQPSHSHRPYSSCLCLPSMAKLTSLDIGRDCRLYRLTATTKLPSSTSTASLFENSSCYVIHALQTDIFLVMLHECEVSSDGAVRTYRSTWCIDRLCLTVLQQVSSNQSRWMSMWFLKGSNEWMHSYICYVLQSREPRSEDFMAVNTTPQETSTSIWTNDRPLPESTSRHPINLKGKAVIQ